MGAPQRPEEVRGRAAGSWIGTQGNRGRCFEYSCLVTLGTRGISATRIVEPVLLSRGRTGCPRIVDGDPKHQVVSMAAGDSARE